MYGFSKWTEQAFQNSIKLLRWCPNKDLLAVLHDSSDVEVFRLPSWTVVCTLSDPRATASISAISWKPDGKSLATGYSDGTVKVFDVETGTQQCVLQGGSAELACLEWMKWGTVAPEHQRNISLFAGFDESHLGALPKLDSLSADEHALHAGRTLVGESESDLDVLLMPDVDGNVNLSIAGRLPAGSVSLQDPYQAVAPPRFLQTWLAPDLSSFSTVLARTTTTENRTIEEISLIDFATQLSGIHRAPLQALAAHLAHVDILLDYVGTALNALDKEWRGVQELAQTERAAFKVIMDEHAVQSDLGGELLHLLLVGTPGMILEPYLVQRLNNNNGLKTWHKAFEAGMQNVRRLACLHILPAMERLILHLDGLKGLGKWSQGHGSIEVNLEEVQTIAKTIRMLAMYVENLQSEALCTSKSFVELVKWLGAGE
ncbi:anaphase-promoting complex, cyclosome, subunit 4-domain-containing protein [Powellomyces hirtus]|nr:anaphase-promoting complex, cyclosome, subunit 4-domain-containing protein [Powellomyces hirtus]